MTVMNIQPRQRTLALNSASLEDLVSSHDIQPLLTYNEKHVLIPPFQYESTLKGALAEVHMTFYHHIKRMKWDVFNAVLCELIVLRPPAAMPKSPIHQENVTHYGTL